MEKAIPLSSAFHIARSEPPIQTISKMFPTRSPSKVLIMNRWSLDLRKVLLKVLVTYLVAIP